MKERPNRVKNLSNQRFGRLICTNIYNRNKNGKIFWQCKCDCGNQNVRYYDAYQLKHGITQSCGCIKSPPWNEYKEILKNRILDSIFISGTCWNWTGKLRKNYPHGIMNAVINGKKSHYQAHRISYLIFKGEIPEGLFVLHECDNGKCVNPNHLHLGTQKDNIREMYERNRANDESKGKKGIDHHKAKLSEKDINEIRELLKTNISGAEIARKFNVSSTLIYEIRKGNIWKHI